MPVRETLFLTDDDGTRLAERGPSDALLTAYAEPTEPGSVRLNSELRILDRGPYFKGLLSSSVHMTPEKGRSVTRWGTRSHSTLRNATSLGVGEADTEPDVVEVHDILEARRRAV